MKISRVEFLENLMEEVEMKETISEVTELLQDYLNEAVEEREVEAYQNELGKYQ